MNVKNPILTGLLRRVKEVAGVPVYGAPVSSAGEKIIWHTTPRGEAFPASGMTLILKFISRNPCDNMARANAVSRALCGPADECIAFSDGALAFGITEESGDGGYIGRTGHFYLTVRYRVTTLAAAGRDDY